MFNEGSTFCVAFKAEPAHQGRLVNKNRGLTKIRFQQKKNFFLKDDHLWIDLNSNR